MNQVLGIIQVVGTLISVGTLMVIGIRYMTGSLEEKASYKKSMLPYVIGSILLFSAVNITSAVYDAISETTTSELTKFEERNNWLRGRRRWRNLLHRYVSRT